MWTKSGRPFPGQRRRRCRRGVPTFGDDFKLRASYFGASDLESLLNSIHKLRAHSSMNLAGPHSLYRRVYIEWSPLNFLEIPTCQVILLQGPEGNIVSAIPSQKMFSTLRHNVVPMAYPTLE